MHELRAKLTNIRYEYVRAFEQPDVLLSNTWIVVRIDGRGFSKYVVLSFLGPLDVLLLRWMQVPVRCSESFAKTPEGNANYSRLTTKYKFEKPNDRAALDLMNEAARAVMKELPDLVLAYGNSDEFRYAALHELCVKNLLTRCSFVFHKDCMLFERRARYGVARLRGGLLLTPQQQAHYYNRFHFHLVLCISLVKILTRKTVEPTTAVV